MSSFVSSLNTLSYHATKLAPKESELKALLSFSLYLVKRQRLHRYYEHELRKTRDIRMQANTIKDSQQLGLETAKLLTCVET